MMNQLYETLLAIHNERKTGQVYITGKQGVFARSGTISVKDGDILQVSFMNEANRSAIASILATKIDHVVFMTASHTDDIAQLDAPNITEVLTQLQSGIQSTLNLPRENELKQEVIRIVQSFYGNGVTKKLDSIAEEFPPDLTPVEFLDKCKALVTPMLGGHKADKMFQKLYKKAH